MLSQGLQTFLLVVEQGSFAKAAKLLYITPASVMKQMNNLEERLGFQLMHRTSKGAVLTAAGKSLYQSAKRLAREADNAVSKARAAQQNEGIIIRIGSSFLNPAKVLTNLWAPLREKYPQYKFSIVPFDDASGQILSQVAAIGEKFDVMVGALNSEQMKKACNYWPLGFYQLCVAVPRGHSLAKKERLAVQNLHRERLVIPSPEDSAPIQRFHDMIRMTHPQILIEDTGYYYDLETFNLCQQKGWLLLTLDAWSDAHPDLITLPVEWNFTVPYGVLYAKAPNKAVAQFVRILQEIEK